jgi:hypothetical protein
LLESDLQAKAGAASQLQEQVSELQSKLLDASQRDMDNQGAQDALQQQLSSLRCAAAALHPAPCMPCGPLLPGQGCSRRLQAAR